MLRKNRRGIWYNHLTFAKCLFSTDFDSPWSKISYLKVTTALKVSLFGIFLVHIFPHSEWIRRDTSYLHAFSLNAGKYRPEKLRKRTPFTQWTWYPFSYSRESRDHDVMVLFPLKNKSFASIWKINWLCLRQNSLN